MQTKERKERKERKGKGYELENNFEKYFLVGLIFVLFYFWGES